MEEGSKKPFLSASTWVMGKRRNRNSEEGKSMMGGGVGGLEETLGQTGFPAAGRL